ncbi:hypothetical protein P8629_12560, partial [Hydrogenovibrio sp. 3SP14C1]|uniref:hypothetical protein n=1 Tax=Hydrogenovibrio sp. 3SP14C1 TaxID=3038774 RepID=UPI0024178483
SRHLSALVHQTTLWRSQWPDDKTVLETQQAEWQHAQEQAEQRVFDIRHRLTQAEQARQQAGSLTDKIDTQRSKTEQWLKLA